MLVQAGLTLCQLLGSARAPESPHCCQKAAFQFRGHGAPSRTTALQGVLF